MLMLYVVSASRAVSFFMTIRFLSPIFRKRMILWSIGCNIDVFGGRKTRVTALR
ncbi:hypothetical protein DPMN_065215 [Dreissena polymorpha]|uniref:Uncharacterized protein n=1 Tax=Dreissena polymorpha TaxID=45954 RepID=A0A9D4CEL5_DREPO|nr:hypothetical protein DPMN_065215 [Dreissena polymorpha]